LKIPELRRECCDLSATSSKKAALVKPPMREAAPARPQARRNAALRVHIYSSAPDYLTLIRMLMHGGAGYVKAG
jgi:hypothetical protein